MVIEARREGMKKQSSNIISPFASKSTPSTNAMKQRFKEKNSILKFSQSQANPQPNTTNNTPQRLPNQYSNNNIVANNILSGSKSTNMTTASINNTDVGSGEQVGQSVDESTSFANMINWYNESSKPTYHINNLSYKVSPSITVILSKLKRGFNIANGGADTYVLGNIWKPLYPIDDNIPRADVKGFDSNAIHKKGLLVGSYATKTTIDQGKEVILRAKHVVGNSSSSHSLLCIYQMRETCIIVDDVSKNHTINNRGEKAHNPLHFKMEQLFH